jgi:hypothetical protein
LRVEVGVGVGVSETGLVGEGSELGVDVAGLILVLSEGDRRGFGWRSPWSGQKYLVLASGVTL